MKFFLGVLTFILLLTAQFYLSGQIKKYRLEQGIDFQLERDGLDPVEFVGTNILSSFRGLMVDFLWVRSHSRYMQDNLEELPVIYNLITSLQPNFVESSAFAASHLGMDISIKFETVEKQWYWIHEALKLFQKSIDRNQRHPNVWKLYQYRAFLISQKCLPTAPHYMYGQECYQFFKDVYGQDPHEFIIDDYRKLLDYSDDVPGGWLFSYSHAYELWALVFDEPQKQRLKIEKALEAWQETIQRCPSIEDEQTLRGLQIKLNLCRHYEGWKEHSLAQERQLWWQFAHQLARFQWRDPLLEKQLRSELSDKNENLYARVLMDEMHWHLKYDRWVTVMEIGEGLKMSHQWQNLLGWEQIEREYINLMAITYDNVQGGLSYAASQEVDENQKKLLIQRSISYKKKALEAYRELSVFEPGNLTASEKIKNLERELSQ